MKTITQLNQIKNYVLIIVLFAVFNLFPKQVSAQVTFLENFKITDEAFYFWKADDNALYQIELVIK